MPMEVCPVLPNQHLLKINIGSMMAFIEIYSNGDEVV